VVTSSTLASSLLPLSHLAEPVAARLAMRVAVRAGGWIVVEDLVTGTVRSDPPAPALARLQAVSRPTVRAHRDDPTIGPASRALRRHGLGDVRDTTVENR
jgi:hypothetical protein